jgi:serine/threonine protein kinase
VHLTQACGHLTEAEAQRIFRQCVSALITCQRRRVCHRDLKPENILLDAQNNVKIADFGLASVVAPGSQLLEYCGTPAFSAPELFSGAQYDGSLADVWSMGVVLYECLSGALPFRGGSVPELIKSICRRAFFSLLLSSICRSASTSCCLWPQMLALKYMYCV